MVSGLLGVATKARFLVNSNSPAILSGMGIVGTAATAYLTGRATVKATRRVDQKNRELKEKYTPERLRELAEELDSTQRTNSIGPNELNHELLESVQVVLAPSAKVKLVWRLYIPATLTGITTIAAIFMANRIAAARIAAMIAAAGVSERAFQEYKDKVISELGERQHTKIRDSVAQDRVTNNPLGPHEVVVLGEGKVLCMDMLSGRYFESTNEDLKRAENKINHQLVQHMDASLSEFYEEIGLAPTSYSDSVGWNASNLVQLDISTAMSVDQRPCLAVDFRPHPFSTYSQFHE